ncbi:GNAT family N-acetyltransferase [Microbulbifer agarilyticus]
MKIEPSSPKDGPEILDIFNLAREENGSFPSRSYCMSAFQETIDGEKILVARIAGEMAGFVSVWTQSNFLHHLFVTPKYQRKGVGKALVSAIVCEIGLPISLKCIKGNTQARHFYEKLGWQPREESTGPEGPYILYELRKNA